MKKDHFLNSFEANKVSAISGRYFPYAVLENFLKTLPNKFTLKPIGKSVLNRNIYTVEIGKGPTRILLWSQMHGNESTTTKAILDLIRFLEDSDDDYVKRLLSRCRLRIIPVLNPDGAEAYTRYNARQIDLNRDALAETQPEIKVLKNEARDFRPDFCFNLHDQRSIFGVGNTDRPATLSFLSPAFNENRDINRSRKVAMQLIAGINDELQKYIPGQIGRYDDKFNPNCIGDYFQAQNIPTLLVEAGHYPKDYQREVTRKYVFLGLCRALDLLSTQNWTAFTPSGYFKIHQNKKSFYDIIIRDVVWENNKVDMALHYEECLINKEVKFIPKIKKIQSRLPFFGHRIIDANHEKLEKISPKSIKIGEVVENIVINGKIIPIL